MSIRLAIRAMVFTFILGGTQLALAQPAPFSTAGLIVDKKSNSLQLVDFTGVGYTVLKTYHATLGRVSGDKQQEGDKKTPEGVYFFEEIRRAPKLQKKFGRMALTMNYPNCWDRFMKRTGSGVWLHSTDEPDRLTKNFDSLGCVVVDDGELKELYSHIAYRTSPILIFDDFEGQKKVFNPERMRGLEAFVKSWAQDWSEKNLDGYVAHYHRSFTNNGKDIKQWRAYKGQLNHNYAKINVQVEHLIIVAHPKYDVAIFNQVYDAKLKNGTTVKHTSGVKILYMAGENGAPKILSEEFRDTHL